MIQMDQHEALGVLLSVAAAHASHLYQMDYRTFADEIARIDAAIDKVQSLREVLR